MSNTTMFTYAPADLLLYKTGTVSREREMFIDRALLQLVGEPMPYVPIKKN
jgi:hypothetical protein